MNQSVEGTITQARRRFHQSLVEQGIVALSTVKKKVTQDGKKVIQDVETASMADTSQETSRIVGVSIAKAMGAQPGGTRLTGQSQGALFEGCTRDFIRETLPSLAELRPGTWHIECVGGSRTVDHLARYEPYRHLEDLTSAIKRDRTLQSALGNIYSVSPDVLVLRAPEPDTRINRQELVVDGSSARLTRIRRDNPGPDADFIHAVVSCKYTMRSDRAQNARSEALNLIRNRKGRTPHIMVLTAEPTPSRLSSLALGTGDIDTLYHVALPELQQAVEDLGNDEAMAMLDMLVEGRRVRDISDMPLDMSI